MIPGTRVLLSADAFKRGKWPVNARRYYGFKREQIIGTVIHWGHRARRTSNKGLVRVQWDKYATCERVDPSDLEEAFHDWEIRRIEPPPTDSDSGQRLYEVYCREFRTVFAPKWEDLTDNSKRVWADVANGALVEKGES